MGLFDFVREAGEAIFGRDDDAPEAAATRDLEEVLADKKKAASLEQLVAGMDLGIEKLDIKFRSGVATLEGTAPSQANREKAVLLVGNTQGVAQVDDRLGVEAPEPEARMHTVESGESLSKIAKQYYGDPMKYTVIFEANQPMLKDPDRIYPGQVLRIPALD